MLYAACLQHVSPSPASSLAFLFGVVVWPSDLMVYPSWYFRELLILAVLVSYGLIGTSVGVAREREPYLKAA